MQNHHDCTRIAKDSSGDLEDDHLQVQIHHDCIMMVMVDVCTRVAKDSSGDLEDDHLQVQIHHDCIMMVMVDVLGFGTRCSNFLNYFFKEKNLKPSIIAGYRITMVDCFA